MNLNELNFSRNFSHRLIDEGKHMLFNALLKHGKISKFISNSNFLGHDNIFFDNFISYLTNSISLKRLSIADNGFGKQYSSTEKLFLALEKCSWLEEIRLDDNHNLFTDDEEYISKFTELKNKFNISNENYSIANCGQDEHLNDDTRRIYSPARRYIHYSDSDSDSDYYW